MPRSSIVLLVLGLLLVWFAGSGALGYLGARWAVISLGVVGTTLMWLYLLRRRAAGARGPGWLALGTLGLWTGLQLLVYGYVVWLYRDLTRLDCLPDSVPPTRRPFTQCEAESFIVILAELLVWSGTGVGVLLGSIALARGARALVRHRRRAALAPPREA